jgi:hypothetical protein
MKGWKVPGLSTNAKSVFIRGNPWLKSDKLTMRTAQQ